MSELRAGKLRFHELVGPFQRGGDIVGCCGFYFVLGELFVALSGFGGSTFLDAGEEEFALFAFGGFGVALGLQLGAAELGACSVIGTERSVRGEKGRVCDYVLQLLVLTESFDTSDEF